MGPDQGVTIDEVTRIFTLNGTYASVEEGIKRGITSGKLEELVMLDRDPRFRFNFPI